MRLYRVTFVAGLAAGYALGTRAGRERYDQMRKLVRSFSDSPAVQQAAGALQANATGMVKSAWDRAATGGRRGVARMRGRSAGSDQSTVGNRAASGNGYAGRPDRDDKRPFVPVDGDFGDRGLS
ncbi:MAG TPA: hypothetical protein VN840_06050 [Streptosporangiaceae bacterium]|nr:hypothetical protein [Streptosporangiaceae bacterium]